MATKPTSKKPPKPRKQIRARDNAEMAKKGSALATLLISPEFAAYRVIDKAQPKHLAEGIDVPGMFAVLRDQAASANRGDLTHAEAMLMNQAAALQSLFVHLTERGMTQTQMPNLEGLIRLARRA